MGDDNEAALDLLHRGTWEYAINEDRMHLMGYDRAGRIHGINILEYQSCTHEDIRRAICELADIISAANKSIHT